MLVLARMYLGKQKHDYSFVAMVWGILALFILGASTALAFNIGDRVQTTGTFNVRQTPAGTVLGTQSTGASGTVTAGPTNADLNGTTYTWYDIDFDTGVDGWVASTGLSNLVVVPATNPVNSWAVGADVYTGNGTINWFTVKATGLNFAFAKASEGVSFTDSQYVNNMVNAKAAGILIGSYHFAHPLDNTGTNGAVAEAQHFLAVAGPYITNGYLPAVLDVEDEPFGTDPTDPCSDGTVNGNTSINLVCKMGKPALSAWVRAWVNYVKQQTGITPILYMNRNSATNGMESDLAACPLWLAYFKTPPDVSQASYPPWTNSWTFLQYSFTNTLSGVPNPTVDFNLFSGDARALQLFAAQIATTNIIPPQISGVGGGPILPPTNGLFQFEISSATQSPVSLQSSTNATNWVNAGSVPLNHSHGTFTTIFSATGQKYYRPHP